MRAPLKLTQSYVGALIRQKDCPSQTASVFVTLRHSVVVFASGSHQAYLHSVAAFRPPQQSQLL